MKKHVYSLIVVLCAISLVGLVSPAQAVTYFNADFEGSDFVVGESVPTGTSMPDRPYYLDLPSSGSIENSGSVSGPALISGKFMRLQDVDDYSAHGAHFDLYDTAYNSGTVKISWDVLFESYDYYLFYTREGRGTDPLHPYKNIIGDIRTSPNGMLVFDTETGFNYTTTYDIGQSIHFDSIFDLEKDEWSVMINGTVLFSGADTPDSPLGAFIVGLGHDTDLTGALQIDNVQVVPIPGSVLLLGSGVIGLIGLKRKFFRGHYAK